jgi:uncharacterized protein (DUF488 family)
MIVARTVYTIGYSTHTLDSFANVLIEHGVNAVADVRSRPYSRYKPEFNKDSLGIFLKEKGIAYIFLGDLCGARIDAPECYTDGKADFGLIAKHPMFIRGLERIINGMEKYSVALMCAEKDPISCHRTILICRRLRSPNVMIRHILFDGAIEEHHDAEIRLMKLFDLDQPNLFADEHERLDQAYDLQAAKIAYEDHADQPALNGAMGE